MKLTAVTATVLIALTSGCASYVTPGAGVSIPEITDAGIAETLARKPAATFPAHLVVARVQASGYESASNRSYGGGRYSVVTTRDIETEADFARLGAMPQVTAVAPVNRLLLPGNLTSAEDVRRAAASLHGDIVMLYTIDTKFRTESTLIGPLQMVSLGFFPNKKAKVTSTCAAAFIDTRTGFVYGVGEFTVDEQQRSDVWNTTNAIEKARSRAERGAFVGALGEMEKVWKSIAIERPVASAAPSPAG